MATTKKSATKSTARPKIGTSHKKAAPKAKTSAAAGAKKSATSAAPAKRATAKKGVDKSRARGTAPRKGEAKRAAVHEAHRGAPVSQRRKAEARAAAAAVPIINETAKQIAVAIATAALDKKAVNVQIFDVAGRVDYADYLVLMSGRAERHAVSIADGIEEALLKMTPKQKPVAVEGRTAGNWVILDYGDVIAHVFLEEARSFYDFDALWNDARRIPLALEPKQPS